MAESRDANMTSTLTVDDVITMATDGVLSNLAIRGKKDTIKLFLYLAVSTLCQKFNLHIATELLAYDPSSPVVTLKNGNLGLFLSLYDTNSNEMKPSSVTDGNDYDYTQIAYNTFVINTKRHTGKENFVAVYSASPNKYLKFEDPVGIPVLMVPAVLDYIAYMANSTVTADGGRIALQYYQKFEKTCQDLENQGYKVNISAEVTSIQAKGWQ